jgi:adenine phosphoribosyltransferase
MISTKLENAIRDIADFPKPGIVFKDITPILKDAGLCSEVIDEFVNRLDGIQIDVIAGIESRGFLFGLMLANKLGIPFVPIRKKGKLPFKTVEEPCELDMDRQYWNYIPMQFIPGKECSYTMICLQQAEL